jgi:hypothetical protein
MRPHDMKYIGFKHQRENKQNSDKNNNIIFEGLGIHYRIWVNISVLTFTTSFIQSISYNFRLANLCGNNISFYASQIHLID